MSYGEVPISALALLARFIEDDSGSHAEKVTVVEFPQVRLAEKFEETVLALGGSIDLLLPKSVKSEDILQDPDEEARKLGVFKKIQNGNCRLLAIIKESWNIKMHPGHSRSHDVFDKVSTGAELSLSKFVEKLSEAGYEREKISALIEIMVVAAVLC